MTAKQIFVVKSVVNEQKFVVKSVVSEQKFVVKSVIKHQNTNLINRIMEFRHGREAYKSRY